MKSQKNSENKYKRIVILLSFSVLIIYSNLSSVQGYQLISSPAVVSGTELSSSDYLAASVDLLGHWQESYWYWLKTDTCIWTKIEIEFTIQLWKENSTGDQLVFEKVYVHRAWHSGPQIYVYLGENDTNIHVTSNSEFEPLMRELTVPIMEAYRLENGSVYYIKAKAKMDMDGYFPFKPFGFSDGQETDWTVSNRFRISVFNDPFPIITRINVSNTTDILTGDIVSIELCGKNLGGPGYGKLSVSFPDIEHSQNNFNVSYTGNATFVGIYESGDSVEFFRGNGLNPTTKLVEARYLAIEVGKDRQDTWGQFEEICSIIEFRPDDPGIYDLYYRFTMESLTNAQNLKKIFSYPIVSDFKDQQNLRVNRLQLEVYETWYKDNDNDGYYDGTKIISMTRPLGYKLENELVSTSMDCNDDNPSINPGMVELCDGIDNNCDGNVDEECNMVPVALFNYSQPSFVGTNITFNASLSYDPDGNITSYHWDFGDGSEASGIVVNHTYSQPGTYLVNLTVTDDDGAVNWTTKEVVVVVNPPNITVNYSISPGVLCVGGEVKVNVTLTNSGGEGANYTLNLTVNGLLFNNTSFFVPAGSTVNHTYMLKFEEAGVYHVKINNLSSTKVTVLAPGTRVYNLQVYPISGVEPLEVTVSVSVSNMCNDPLNFTVDLKVNGNPVEYRTVYLGYNESKNVIFNYTLPYGLHYVTVDGLQGVYVNVTRGVTNALPVGKFDVSPGLPYTGQTVTFNASLSYDPDGNITSYHWDFGDGSEASGIVVNHTYSQPGTYLVNLTVTDDDGAVNWTTKEVVVIPNSSNSDGVIRNLPEYADPNDTVEVILTSSMPTLGMNIVETIPPGFIYLNHIALQAEKVIFEKNGSQLIFTVVDLTPADGFTIVYYLRAPDAVGIYNFIGTYRMLGTGNIAIAGDTVLKVGKGELIPDNFNDTLEQLISKYNPEFNWEVESPTKDDIEKAIVNAVLMYFASEDIGETENILNDITKLINVYFEIST